MGKQKNAAPVLQHRGRQPETRTACPAAITSATQHITPEREKQPRGKIERLLSPGTENALTLHHLVKLTGLPARQVRQLIQAERLQGVPILADNQNGYFLPKSPKDVEEFARSMRHRAKEISRVADAVQQGGQYIDSL